MDTLENNDKFGIVSDYIRFLKRKYTDGQREAVEKYSSHIHNEVNDLLKNDPVWRACQNEWGKGKGFKERIRKHLEEWSGKQQKLTAHQKTETLLEHIPLMAEILREVQSPQFSLHVRNLRTLHQVDWMPNPLSLIIGGNGTGKSTLLMVLKLLRIAYNRDLPDAVTQVLGGSNNLRTWGSSETEPIEIGIDIGEASWRLQFAEREGSVNYTKEHLSFRGVKIFSRDHLENFFYGEERLNLEKSQKLGLRILMERGSIEPALRTISLFMQKISVYHDPDLWTLRKQGSNASDDRLINARGSNALTLLRRWHQERPNHRRYQFVLEGLQSAFPNIVQDLDFIEAGNTLVARIYRPGQETPSPLSDDANGVLQLLVLLCEIAQAENKSVVAMDEPENSLHPYAQRSFLRSAQQWVREHEITIIIATHSEVFLNELNRSPEQVYVMKAKKPGSPIPTQITDLCDQEWLHGFTLGTLYEQGEIGSNEDAPT